MQNNAVKSFSNKSILSVAEAYYQMATSQHMAEAAEDHSAAAASASDRAKSNPSVTNHRVAADAHEKAATALEYKIDSIKDSDPTGKRDSEVMQHERKAKEHKNTAQIHRFHAHRMEKGMSEALDPHADAGVWIKDFQQSDNPKFAGKSAEERKQQALAAWYAARRDAGIKEDDEKDEAGDPGERPEIHLTPDKDNLAATDAADAQKKQEPQGELPSWVPGNLPDDEKKEFVEAAKKAWESDNNTFDFKGRTYKITEGTKNEELVGNQHKLDVDKDGKIEADDLAKLRAGQKPVGEDHVENEVETPGQTEYPGSGMEDSNGNGELDGEDKAKMQESTQLNEGPGQSTYARMTTDRAEEASKHANSYGGQDYHLHMIAHHSHALAAKSHERAASNADDENDAADHSGGASYHHDQADHHLKAANALKEGTISEASASELGKKASGLSSSAKTPADHKAAAKAHYKAAEAFRRGTTGNAGKNPGKAEDAAHSAALKHEKQGDKHHEKSMKNEATENPTDKLTIDVPAMIRALEKSREDFKTDADIHNFVQALLNKKDAEIKTKDLPGEVKEGAPADAKGAPMVLDPLTQQTKDDHDDNTEIKGPDVDMDDGSDEVKKAEKPAANPTPMPKLTSEQATRSVAEAYVKMVSEANENHSQAAETASNATKKFKSSTKRSNDPHGAVKSHLDAAELHAKAAQHADSKGNTAVADHHWHSHNLHVAEAEGTVDEHPKKLRDTKAFRDAAGEVKDYHAKKWPQGHRDTDSSKHPTPAWHPEHGWKTETPNPEDAAAAMAAFKKAYQGKEHLIGR
jgi:hypothetical protein